MWAGSVRFITGNIGVASTLQLGGPHIVKDEMQVEDQLSMLNWGVLP